MLKKKRVRRPCVPDDFEEEFTQEECDLLDKFFPQYEDVVEAVEVEREAKAAKAAKPQSVKCICGSFIMPKGMKSHEKTKKHLAFILQMPDDEE